MVLKLGSELDWLQIILGWPGVITGLSLKKTREVNNSADPAGWLDDLVDPVISVVTRWLFIYLTKISYFDL
jgi:hypothetical protein